MSKQVVVIEREKWIHGEGSSESYLLRHSDGKMCCLGFASLACGLMPEVIEKERAVMSLVRNGVAVPDSLQWLLCDRLNSDAAESLMNVNDCRIGSIDHTSRRYDIHSEADREAYITRVMGENGIDVQFV